MSEALRPSWTPAGAAAQGAAIPQWVRHTWRTLASSTSTSSLPDAETFLVHTLSCLQRVRPGELHVFFDKQRGVGWLGLGDADVLHVEQGTAAPEAMQQLEAWRRRLPPQQVAFFSVPFDVEDRRAAPEWQSFLGVRACVPKFWLVVDDDGVRTHGAPPQSWQPSMWADAQPALRDEVRLLASSYAPGQGDWEAWVDDLVDDITSDSSLQKVVAARRLRLQLDDDVDLGRWLSRRREPHGYLFHWQRDNAVFVGQSPELLCTHVAEDVCTEALAGTAPRGHDDVDDQAKGNALLQSAKDRHEQALITAYIEKALAPYARVDVGPLQLKRLATVQHLQTDVRARLKTFPDVGVVGLLHPTPAVAGLPRMQAQQHLRVREPFHRGLYAGALGVMTSSSLVACVALRSMLLHGRQVDVFTGAGIVEGSVGRKEWDELQHKGAAALDALLGAQK